MLLKRAMQHKIQTVLLVVSGLETANPQMTFETWWNGWFSTAITAVIFGQQVSDVVHYRAFYHACPCRPSSGRVSPGSDCINVLGSSTTLLLCASNKRQLHSLPFVQNSSEPLSRRRYLQHIMTAINHPSHACEPMWWRWVQGSVLVVASVVSLDHLFKVSMILGRLNILRYHSAYSIQTQ